MNKRLFSTLAIFLIILIVTAFVIAYGRGYRPDFKTKNLSSTGLLVATSFPDGAQVFVNGKLKTATNNTISLLPDWYDVKIIKDGYFPWEKHLRIQGEIVTKTDTRLFSTTPSLRALTNAGVLNPVLSPNGNRIAYGTATGSAEKQGVYVMDLTEQAILKSVNRQILSDTTFFTTLSKANFLWSPDGKRLLAYFIKQITDNLEPKETKEIIIENAYLLDTDKYNEVPEDITLTYDTVLSEWEKDLLINEKQRINSLKSKKLREFVNSWQVFSWTPNETKMIYTATASATLPQILKPALIGSNCQPEERNLTPGKIYVYDIKEDKNFEIGDLKDLIPNYPLPFFSLYPHIIVSSHPIQWLPESRHLIIARKDRILIMEYDGHNRTTVYSGPFVDSFIFPWPDASKLVILTNYNPTAGPEPNLYSVTLR